MPISPPISDRCVAGELHWDLATPSGKDAAGENFPVGSLLVRARLRPHVHAFYRFARMADDIADNPVLDAEEKIRRLDLIEAALLDQEMAGSIPVAARMRASLAETGIGAVHCRDLLRAFRLDAVKNRYPDWSELMTYCRYSAAPVGRYLLDLHGESTASWPAADALCAALQIINHLQDCALDYREMDRVYLPLDLFAASGAEPAALAAPACSPSLRRVLDASLERTDQLLRSARPLLPQIGDSRLRAESAVIGALAGRLVDNLRRRDPLRERVKLGRREMLLGLLGGLRAAWGAGHS